MVDREPDLGRGAIQSAMLETIQVTGTNSQGENVERFVPRVDVMVYVNRILRASSSFEAQYILNEMGDHLLNPETTQESISESTSS